MSLPRMFVWTRFGTEAGQAIECILARKEDERRQNGGLFLWGIGNNISASIPALLESTNEPHAVFSPIKSKPKPHDVTPGRIAIWTGATAATGDVFNLPEHSVVTSRYTDRKHKHFALVCGSNTPLSLEKRSSRISMDRLVNARSGTKLGFSQVTAVVERTGEDNSDDSGYDVSMCCRLVFPFVVTLHDPIVFEDSIAPNLNELPKAVRPVEGRPERTEQLALQL